MTTHTSPVSGPRSDLLTGWTDLWNGDLDQAERLCSPTLRIHFGGKRIAPEGDAVTTPHDLAALISTFRSTRPGLRYAVVEARTTTDWGYCIWDASMDDLQVGGIDTFAFDENGIRAVHSVTAERPMSAPSTT